jgi:hypothetical protein
MKLILLESKKQLSKKTKPVFFKLKISTHFQLEIQLEAKNRLLNEIKRLKTQVEETNTITSSIHQITSSISQLNSTVDFEDNNFIAPNYPPPAPPPELPAPDSHGNGGNLLNGISNARLKHVAIEVKRVILAGFFFKLKKNLVGYFQVEKFSS